MLKSQSFLAELNGKLDTFDNKGADLVCKDLITYLYSTDVKFDAKDAERIMQQLRNKRLFKFMQQVGDAFIQTGRQTFKIRRQYAQALIDQNIFTAAISVLNQLVVDTSMPSMSLEENYEARGLLGRVYKQLYVNANKLSNIDNADLLNKAIFSYYKVYQAEPRINTWHGINVVALLHRAKKDNISISGISTTGVLAKEILKIIEDKHADRTADAWNFATAGEACIALNRPEDALEWFSGYARMPYCDAFELASTLRQLEEVWQLNMDSESGKLVLPLLRAELLERKGGNVIIDVVELQKQNAQEDTTTYDYKSLVKECPGNGNVVLEKVFGDESFKSYKWYMTGAARCLAVARIGLDATKGFGTGFLLKGYALHESLGEELVLITNAHVVSDNPVEKSLRSHEAVIIFEPLNRDEEFKVGEIFWSSPSTELDTTVIKFRKDDHARLKELTNNVKIYPVSEYLPAIEEESPAQRIYIIGHPAGGTLQLSFQDNILLDHENPKIHYRTPTVGGSSGSPVFNQQWDLIGLHHAGSSEMKCLNKKPGTYEANEGIWLQAVKKAIQGDNLIPSH
jgi:V8-like Glu-specific endopeptidase